ncbi:MAG: MmcQ/YjbR family DNA-binding protein [Candidatus Acidiferrales bacterium]
MGARGAAAMTAAEFRRLALSFPEATEGAHMDHPDFRVRGKIFATLGYPEAGVGMVKLFPDQQQEFVRADPKVFAPVNGLWGRRGATYVRLKVAKKGGVQRALAAAWRNTASRILVAQYDGADSGAGVQRR